MANPERGETPLSVDGRTYLLVCTTSAQIEMEAQLSTPTTEVTTGDILVRVSKRSQTATRAFLWACLLQHHRADFPTPEATNPLMDRLGWDGAFAAINQAWTLAQPDPEDIASMTGVRTTPPPAATRGGPKSPPRRSGGTGPRSTAALDGQASTATASGR